MRKLQTQFRKSHSERGSYLEVDKEIDNTNGNISRHMGSTGTAMFYNNSSNKKDTSRTNY